MNDATQQIAYHILAYLAKHPDAQDTTKGISEWWLSEHTGQPSTASVERVLRRLVRSGLIVSDKREGPESLYKLNQLRLEEIRVNREELERVVAAALLTQDSDRPSD